MIDQALLRDNKKEERTLLMLVLIIKKTYDLVPLSWVMDTLEMVGAAENVKHSLRRVCEELENAVRC